MTNRPANETRRLILWNAKVGRRPAEVVRAVRSMAREHDADGFLLQEAAGYFEALRDLPGWDAVAPRGKGDARGNIILAPERSHVERRHAIRCRLDWTGPKHGKHHDGRKMPVADVDDWRYVSVHRTRPGWSKGGLAFAEEFERLAEVADRTRIPLVLGGDQNIGTRPGADRGRHTPFALARRIGGTIITTHPGNVDYVIVRGLTGKAWELGEYGSDHNAVLVTLRRLGNRR